MDEVEKKFDVVFCPRCDRKYTKDSVLHEVSKQDLKDDLLGVVKKHVLDQHPDHDPYWYETL